MKLFNFFKKKNKKEKEDQVEEPMEVKSPVPDYCAMCFYCKEPIYSHEKRKTFNGKKYHIKCFRKFKAGKF